MVYLTGDIHGVPWEIRNFAKKMCVTYNDTIIILGDVGANYYMDSRDEAMKTQLNKNGANILCIHGNHEVRPSNIASYELTDWNGGKVWTENKYPNIKFAKDGEIYTIEGTRFIAIGGAYSVDKYYRLARNAGWWEDEQPSLEIKEYVEEQLSKHQIDIVLSHTCPYKYEPVEMFLTQVDQSTIDKSTEEWLDKLESQIEYKAWFCGHWHTDKIVDKMHFLFNSWETTDNIIKRCGEK